MASSTTKNTSNPLNTSINSLLGSLFKIRNSFINFSGKIRCFLLMIG